MIVNSLLKPRFFDSKLVQIAIATLDFCNARCESCIWPFMRSQSKVMNRKNFNRILDYFDGFNFSKFAFNVINEPFIDQTIVQKLQDLVERKIFVSKLYFSSNWLLPNLAKISEFVDTIKICDSSSAIKAISLNATVSGIDDPSYDRLQAGSMLSGTTAKYHPLNFQKASENICEIVRQLASIHLKKPIVFYVKAYGNLFNQERMIRFWNKTLLNYNVPSHFLENHVKISLNHGKTSFARFKNGYKNLVFTKTKSCKSNFLNEKLTIGSSGEVGLCCNDGIRSVVIGNIFEKTLDSLVSSESFQKHLRIVTGIENPDKDHPCSRCEFYA